MEWLYVIIAGFLEVLSVNYMNLWQIQKKPLIIVKMAISFISSLILLNLAMDVLPMSITYAVWSGIGSVGGVAVGIIKYGESADWRRLVCICMILSSVVGLKLIS